METTTQQIPGQQIDAGQGAGAPPEGGQQAPQTAQSVNLSAESIAELSQNLGRALQPPVKAPEMTEEEFNQRFNIFNPKTEQWQALRGDDESAALKALNDMLQGTSKQAVTLAVFSAMQEMERRHAAMQEQFSPALKFAESQQMEAMKNEFYNAYPDLKGLEPLLLSIRDRFIQSKTQFQDKDSAFKAVAEEAYGILSKVPGFKRGTPQPAGGQNPPSRQPTRMPTLSGVGGQGGSGDGKTASPNVNPTVAKLFGPR